MAEINKISVFKDESGNPRYALVDSQNRIIIAPRPCVPTSSSTGSIPSGSEYSVVSYTVPTGYKFYLTGWSATGTADGTFRLYRNSIVLIERRNSVAVPDVGNDFTAPIEFSAGETVEIKVQHYESSVQSFRGTLFGYTLAV